MVFTYDLPSGYTAYVGRDKYENEDLIRCALPCDVWFHVDALSSAHVYLRLHDGDTLDSIPENALEECCQLVKARSIRGCKLHETTVVYTMASNLLKTQAMDVGQVGFHDDRARRFRRVVKNNQTVTRVERLRTEQTLDQHRVAYDDFLREEKRTRAREYEDARRREAAAARASRERARIESYADVMCPENMTTNDAPFDEDDFM